MNFPSVWVFEGTLGLIWRKISKKFRQEVLEELTEKKTRKPKVVVKDLGHLLKHKFQVKFLQGRAVTENSGGFFEGNLQGNLEVFCGKTRTVELL